MKKLRNRGAVVILEEGKALLIKRVNDSQEYYVFPGGGIEIGETPEEAAIREAKEELGVTVELKGCLHNIDFFGSQHYFLAEIVDGVAGSGLSEEFQNSGRGTYQPVWISIEEFPQLNIKPEEIARKVLSLYI
ncbi:MAG: NUDIX hydrolase [Bacillota bacterium]